MKKHCSAVIIKEFSSDVCYKQPKYFFRYLGENKNKSFYACARHGWNFLRNYDRALWEVEILLTEILPVESKFIIEERKLIKKISSNGFYRRKFLTTREKGIANRLLKRDVLGKVLPEKRQHKALLYIK